jgi:hypothetical protein
MLLCCAAAIPLDRMTDEDFERHALAVLQRELGLDGLARFLRVYRAGTGDYTRDRHRWLDGATVMEHDVTAALSLRRVAPRATTWRCGAPCRTPLTQLSSCFLFEGKRS